MEKLSALKPRCSVFCPERLLFVVRNGAWFVETIRASGQMCRANRPDTRLHLTMYQSPKRACKAGAIHTGQSCRCLVEPRAALAFRLLLLLLQCFQRGCTSAKNHPNITFKVLLLFRNTGFERVIWTLFEKTSRSQYLKMKFGFYVHNQSDCLL